MTTNLNTENGNIKNINIELTPLEFLTLKQILNLNCVYAELTETDRQTAEQIFKSFKEILTQNRPEQIGADEKTKGSRAAGQK